MNGARPPGHPLNHHADLGVVDLWDSINMITAKLCTAEFRSCVKVEVAVLGSPS